jgi:hypothetical protein
MRLALIGAVASVALASVTATALAQAPGAGEGPGKTPGASPSSPGAPGAGAQGERGRGSSEPGMKRPDGNAEGRPPASGRSAQEGDRGRETPKGSESPGRSTPKASEGPAEKQRPKASERPDTDKRSPRSTETRPDRDTPKATETRPGRDTPKSTETKPDRGAPKSTETRPDQGQAGRVQVSDQQRTNVRERLMREGRHQKTKVDVKINVGARVPRSVRLLPLPVAIIDIAPSYRGYSYIVTEDDTICIVNPRSYEVVDVIVTGTQHAGRPPAGVRLSLSQEQMRFVAGHVSRERRANVHVRLALGAEVPRDVELLDFPRDVMERVPELERYRYIISENDVVVVDPNGRDVALVISE